MTSSRSWFWSETRPTWPNRDKVQFCLSFSAILNCQFLVSTQEGRELAKRHKMMFMEASAKVNLSEDAWNNHRSFLDTRKRKWCIFRIVGKDSWESGAVRFRLATLARSQSRAAGSELGVLAHRNALLHVQHSLNTHLLIANLLNYLSIHIYDETLLNSSRTVLWEL